MFVSHGKYSTAIIYAKTVEENASMQIYGLLYERYVEGSRIRVMPNVCVGEGCAIGTTMSFADGFDLSNLPNLLGSHIACGTETVLLAEKAIDFNKLDDAIRALHTGSGYRIELAATNDSDLYLIVRSGGILLERQHVDEDYLKELASALSGETNARKAVVQELSGSLGLTVRESFTTNHNYIDLDSMILRKGAVSAKKGETSLIGNFICVGKGNDDWNCSAPAVAVHPLGHELTDLMQDTVEITKSLKTLFASE